MIIKSDTFNLISGDIVMVNEEECVLQDEQPIESYKGRYFKPWAAKSPLGGYYPVVEVLEEIYH